MLLFSTCKFFTLSFYLLFLFPVIYPSIHRFEPPEQVQLSCVPWLPHNTLPHRKGASDFPLGYGKHPWVPLSDPGGERARAGYERYANPLNPTDEKTCCNSTETVNFLRTHLFPNRVRMLTTSYFKHILFSPPHFPTLCSIYKYICWCEFLRAVFNDISPLFHLFLTISRRQYIVTVRHACQQCWTPAKVQIFLLRMFTKLIIVFTTKKSMRDVCNQIWCKSVTRTAEKVSSFQ